LRPARGLRPLHSLLGEAPNAILLTDLIRVVLNSEVTVTMRVHELESKNNAQIAEQYELDAKYAEAWPVGDVALIQSPWAGWKVAGSEAEKGQIQRIVNDLVSYAVGCVFGRYSLDEPGLILADQGTTLRHYFARVSSPTFAPDKDNVIPIVDGDWFEDDIVARFRQFLRAAFGDQYFEQNLQFVTDSLGVKSLRTTLSSPSTRTTSSGTRSARSTGCSPAPRARSTR